MSNSRAFRRRLRASAEADDSEKPRRQPWNKGRAMTSTPSLSTTRRWLEVCVDEGLAERRAARTGKPGRPPIEYRATEEGIQRPSVPPEVERIQWERLRREENARKRRKIARDAERLKAAQAKVARAGQRLAVAESAVRQAEAEQLNAEILFRATRALLDAGGDESVLLAEEAAVLAEYGCVRPGGERLVLTDDYAEVWAHATSTT